jgi:leucyl-tRNA synthetase
LIRTEIDISENDLLGIINNDEKIFKYIDGKEIKKKIYIKNKLINIIL